VAHQPEPRLIKQILRDIAAARQSHQERQQPRVERRVHLVERFGIADAKLLD
jgi:hypothetical protein